MITQLAFGAPVVMSGALVLWAGMQGVQIKSADLATRIAQVILICCGVVTIGAGALMAVGQSVP